MALVGSLGWAVFPITGLRGGLEAVRGTRRRQGWIAVAVAAAGLGFLIAFPPTSTCSVPTLSPSP